MGSSDVTLCWGPWDPWHGPFAGLVAQRLCPVCSLDTCWTASPRGVKEAEPSSTLGGF